MQISHLVESSFQKEMMSELDMTAKWQLTRRSEERAAERGKEGNREYSTAGCRRRRERRSCVMWGQRGQHGPLRAGSQNLPRTGADCWRVRRGRIIYDSSW